MHARNPAVARPASGQILEDAHVVGTGAARPRDSDWALHAAIGRPQTGPSLCASGFHLYSDFWQPHDAAASDRIFANGFEAPHTTP